MIGREEWYDQANTSLKKVKSLVLKEPSLDTRELKEKQIEYENQKKERSEDEEVACEEGK